MKKYHLRYGTSDDVWIEMSVLEAKSDPVGMWAIVKDGREGFDLSGVDLENFVRSFILALLSSGAKPVIGVRATRGWRLFDKYDDGSMVTIDSLIENWKRSRVDPDVSDVWFVSPSIIK